MHRDGSSRILPILAVAVAAFAAVNKMKDRRAETLNPPDGKFLDVNGVRLHYRDSGAGRPIVFVHGALVSGSDFEICGMCDALRGEFRVINFDRPGYGYSDRPRDRRWTAGEQARILRDAVRLLSLPRPLIVGHSWGAIVAMIMAVENEEEFSGVVALSGYYCPSLRLDVLLPSLGLIPGIGTLLHASISPFISLWLLPLTKRVLFWPLPIPRRFAANFSAAMATRSVQTRASADDAALMLPSVIGLRKRYKQLRLPIAIIAGTSDLVISRNQAKRLNADLPNSTLHLIPDVGHMVHYAVPNKVVQIIQNTMGEVSGG